MENKKLAVELLQEAMLSGARLKPACEVLEISIRTYQRWKKNIIDKRKGAIKKVPRKLSPEENQQIIDIANNNEFKDSTPYEIYHCLLERSTYMGSISTIYRVLRAREMVNHRSNCKIPTNRSKPQEQIATNSNQVWTWDITYLPMTIRGMFYYAYVIIDIWDKSIVGWSIQDRESEIHSRNLFDNVFTKESFPNVHIHSDNGHPMKGTSLMALFSKLHIVNSYSRPRVSNDNPFSESFFKTLKYSPKYPAKFNSIEEARVWMANFIDNYNNNHRHSGINYFTPNQMKSGDYKNLVAIRNQTIKEAREKNPQRWSKAVKQWSTNHKVILNPKNKEVASTII